ncbi:hypothetical protein [Salininema proteolyticum]|uniref:Uncharacterized protein n=1 Tax=Salininema proteolyticum TaxID=1607685 RepID=A0ABV8U170_9ACTN
MAVLYLPPETDDLGTVTHYGRIFQARFDSDAGTVFLLHCTDDADTPVAERPPAAIANVSTRVWSKLTLYDPELYKESQMFHSWTLELRDAVMIALHRHRNENRPD